jgi:hypothetical protein
MQLSLECLRLCPSPVSGPFGRETQPERTKNRSTTVGAFGSNHLGGVLGPVALGLRPNRPKTGLGPESQQNNLVFPGPRYTMVIPAFSRTPDVPRSPTQVHQGS